MTAAMDDHTRDNHVRGRTSRDRQEPLEDLGRSRRWHLVGVGGPGMAPLALLLHACGQEVSGSDMREVPVLAELRDAGVAVHVGHDPRLVEGVDVVVYSTAVPADNVEIVAAREAEIRVCHRAVALGSVCASSVAIGVAGAHGKTTTSALVAAMLRTAGRDTASYIGADVPGGATLPPNGVVDAGTTLVVEADESDGTIEVLPLRALAVTNIDVDHLDYWGDLEGIVAGFADVVASTASRGDVPVVLNADDPLSQRLAAVLPPGRVRWFGIGIGSDVRIAGIVPTSTGAEVLLVVDGQEALVRLPLRGAHNAANLACAVAFATSLGVDLSACVAAAELFGGVERRFSERGDLDGMVVIDDYAHLPAEIAATLAAAREHPRLTGRVIAVFQPNRFHRIAVMADDYAECFAGADHVVITDIYASGTAAIEGVTGRLVVDAVARHHGSVVWAQSRADVVRTVLEVAGPGDICVGMGCGDIATLSSDLGVAVR
jgi:UDP-N-acetylmuramate--alanine ligase